MALILSLGLFVFMMAAVSLIGLKLWVRPKEAMDRVAGISAAQRDHIPVHPSLALHSVLQKIGTALPRNPKDVTVMQRRLFRAGLRGPNALKILYGTKVLFGVLVPAIVSIL